MCFFKTILIYSSNFYFQIVRVGTHLLKKQKQKQNRSAATCSWCTAIKSLLLFLCVHRKKKLKRIEKKGRSEPHYARKQPGKNTSDSKNCTIFKRWQKWPFCKCYSKAKWPRMVYTGTEPQNTKNIQKLPFKIIRIVLRRKLLKNTLIIKKMTRR